MFSSLKIIFIGKIYLYLTNIITSTNYNLAIFLNEKNALIFAADAGVERILQAFKLAMPKAVIAFIIDGKGVENLEEIKEKAGWMIDSFDVYELVRDFDLVLDSTRDLIRRYKELGYSVYVSISSIFSEISAALYAATMYKGGIPLAPESKSQRLPMLRVLMLPTLSLYTLRVLYEDFGGSAMLDNLTEKVIATLKEKEGRERKSGDTLINYHINRKLKPWGLVRTKIIRKKLKVELTNAGAAVARRIDDYMKFLEKPKREEIGKEEKAVIER